MGMSQLFSDRRALLTFTDRVCWHQRGFSAGFKPTLIGELIKLNSGSKVENEADRIMRETEI